MGKKNLTKQLLGDELQNVGKLFNGKDYVVFYGTALGLHRDNDVIDGDDDIDIFIDTKDFDLFNNILLSGGYKQSYIHTGQQAFPGVFCQYIRESVLVDIYCFYNAGKYVVDPWALAGTPNDVSTHVKHLRSDIFPVKSINYAGVQINVPNNSEAICKSIYGSRYMEKLRKDIDYRMTIQNGSLKTIYR